MLAELPLVPFVIINLTRLTAGVCMKVRGNQRFFFLAASRLSHAEKNQEKRDV